MFKKSIFVALLICLAASTAFASFIVKTPINPVVNRFYAVTNSTSNNSFIVYSVYNGDGSAKSQATGTGNVFGLAVNPAGTKLYLSIDEGANSRIVIYSLTSAGDINTSVTPATMSFSAYGRVVMPRGIDFVSYAGQEYYLYAADASSDGVIHCFNLTTQKWVGYTSIKNDFNGGAYTANLHSIAIRPTGNGTAQLFVSQRASAGNVYVYTVAYNESNIAMTKYSSITNLQYPFYLKFAPDGSRLYVAAKGDQGDIFAYSTANLAFLGRVMAISEPTAGWGWNGFDLSPDGGTIYYSQAQDATETTTKLYQASASAISGGNIVAATVMNNNAGIISPADSVICDPSRSKVWVMDSGTGQIASYAVPGVPSASITNVSVAGTTTNMTTIMIGTAATVKWSSAGNIANVRLEYSTAGSSGPWTAIGVTANTGSAVWAVPNLPTYRNFYIRVSDQYAQQIAGVGGPATLVRPITVSQPDGKTAYQRGSIIPIVWDNVNINGSLVYNNVNIYQATSPTGPWYSIGSPANTGSYSWDTGGTFKPLTSSNGTYYIKVAGQWNSIGGDSDNYGVSSAVVISSTLTISAPAGSSLWSDGKTTPLPLNNGMISWSLDGATASTFLLEYRLDGSAWQTISPAFAAPAQYPATLNWTVATGGQSSSQMEVRVTAKDGSGNVLAQKISDPFKLDNNIPNPPAAPAVESHGAVSNVWTNASGQPSFTWTAATDNPMPDSKIVGYTTIFSTSSDADPGTNNLNLKPDAAYTAISNLVNGTNTYYLIVRSCDGASNFSAPATLFVYKYDSEAPQFTTNPISSSTNPSNSLHPQESDWNKNNTPAFSWTAATDPDNGSGLAAKAYYYKLDQVKDQTAANVKNSADGSTDALSRAALYNVPKADGTWYFHVIAADAVGNLSNVQTYTVKIDTVSPKSVDINIIAPAAGELVTSDATKLVTYTVKMTATDNGTSFSYGYIGTVTSEVSVDGGATWTKIDNGTYPVFHHGENPLTFPWSLTAGMHSGPGKALIRAWVTDPAGNTGSGVSGAFTITLPGTPGASSITVDTPKGGETLISGETLYITWESTGTIANVKIEYSADGGTTWSPTPIVASTANTGSYPWTVDSTPTTQGRIRISDAANPAVSGTSGNFTIVSNFPAPTIASIDPDNGIAGNTVTVVNLIGSNFVTGTSVKLVKGTNVINATDAVTYSLTYITCRLVLPATAEIGDWNVVVTNPDTKSATKANGFHIYAPSALPPTISLITPNTGNTGTTVEVTLTGTNFNTGATAKIAMTGQTDIPMVIKTIAPAHNQITATLTIPPLATVGNWTVMVTNTDSQTGQLVNGFSVTGGVTPGAISNINIVRNGDTFGSMVTITWQTNPNTLPVDIYTKTGDFSPNATDWTKAVSNATNDIYGDHDQVGNGIAKYYKIIPSGTTLQNSDLTQGVVGKFDLTVSSVLGYNLVSIPLVQLSTSLSDIIGNQLTGGAYEFSADAVYYPNASQGFDIAWQKNDGHWYQAGTDSTLSPIAVDINKSFYIYINSGNSGKTISLVGLVKTDSAVQVVNRGVYNMIGNPFPAEVALANTGLFASGLKAGNYEFSASSIYVPNASGGYDIAWLNSSGTWYDAGTSNPTSIKLKPGVGYYLYNSEQDNNNPSFTWTYPRPY